MLDQVPIATLNHLLHDAEWARARLLAYAGRGVRFEITPLQFSLAPTADGYFELYNGERTDVVIRLPGDAPFLLVQGLDRLMASAHVEGNAEFATELSFILRNLHWEIEEDLSRVVGDIPAHRALQGIQQVLAWQQQAMAKLLSNLNEYLADENTLLLTQADFAEHRAALGQMLAALDRCEQRLDRAG